jgi:putative transposase
MGARSAEVIRVKKGAVVWSEGKEYTIVALLDLKTALARSHEDGKSYQLAISSLRATKDESNKPELISLVDISEKQWALAQRRFEIIKPLLATPKFYRTQNQVKARADEFRVGQSTVYRWLDLYEATGLLSALVRPKRSDLGRSKVSPDVESIINDVIQHEYLSEQRIKVINVQEEVAARCKKAGLTAPHINTIRNRIKSLPEALRVRKRRGRQMAKGYEPLQGTFPGADWPLAYVQIDHTRLDIILVDDTHRQPVGRPYITLAMDVFSRMVAGFYLSFDPPSCFTAGMCIAHAILPKDRFLANFDTASEWPLAGKMQTIHADNALEFRSDILKRACDQHQINLEWRPVREPQYGGHVERLFRTINTRIHNLPGTTFSNTKDREKYESEKHSAFTLDEFEKWLTVFIVDKYHQSFHSEINMSPIRRFEQGILGDAAANVIGIGMPPRVVDEERFRIDFMPYVKRTIQNYGMRNHKIYYYHDVLRPWINAKEREGSKSKRLFVFHYDPRDVSKYYFWDPDIKQYFTIPYRDNRHPPISMWEAREAARRMREEGLSNIDENLLFETHEKLKQITLESVSKTRTERKRQRREEQRKRDHQRQMSREKTHASPALKTIVTNPFTNIDFDEIEELPIDDDC